MKVSNILSRKGNAVHSISPNVTVFEALTVMAEKNLSALVVTEGNSLVGIFTERDYARKVVLVGKFSKETLVSEVMKAAPLITVTEDTLLTECMGLMTNKFVRHLPVMRGEELVGIISIGDVVKTIINDQQTVIESLRNYIAG